ncbi:MAG: tRNA (adenosine(37)-N6)-dimethylallyltransferase MiaA [Bacteroidota bacterium]|nr:tRNA (adenosine(37)-N6)-dimethylallyltransferase MiaA [Bacteroidota bacterium]
MNPSTLKPHTLFVIAGPTAVGKTAVGIQLALQLGCSIISADSRQFYKEMKIGTAVPSDVELAQVKHFFIQNKSVTEDYNVSQYEIEVLSMLPDMFSINPNLVMVGGSGLYIDAVCNGIDDMPDTDAQVRNQLNEAYKKEGIKGLQDRLLECDPDYYKEVDLKNPARLQRAIAVFLQTGIPYSKLRMKVKKERDFNIVKIGITLDKPTLHDRIELRVDHMIDSGLPDEVRSLMPYRHLNALNTVGYKELFAYLDGEVTLEHAMANIKTNTRRYAKRQFTWFRKDQDMQWFYPDEILNLIKKKGNIGQYRLFR